MPKKKKNTSNQENDNECPNEGRPKGRLTLGDFLTAQIEKKGAQKSQSCVKGAQTSSAVTVPCPPELGNTSNKSDVVKTDGHDLIGSVTCSLSAVNLENKDGGISSENNLNCEVTTASTRNDRPKYFVCRSKKGGIPVKVENRSSGKKVTLIEHVRGEGKVLVQEMKTKFGTGGLYKDDTIELQGDCKVKVTKYLNENKHLLKPYGTK